MHIRFLICLCCPLVLSGCGQGGTAVNGPADPNLPIVSQTLIGRAKNGQQPIAGAHVYLLAANITGYGDGSASLLVADSTGYSDALGAYVLTASDGSFSISGTYSCASGNQQAYLYVLGGDAGSGVNSAIGELAVLGDCPSLTAPALPSLDVNEVSTIAAAYAIAGFAKDATHVSSSGTSLAQTGVANAFASAANIASLSTGTALNYIPSGNARVPQSTTNTLANILAACIHSAGPSSSGCSTLLSNTEAGGVESTDTATTAINIAHSPASNVTALYALQTLSSPFSPALMAIPNDFSIGLNFAGSYLNVPECIAIDGSGNVWIVNGDGNDVTELSSSGVLLSGANGYTDGLNGPDGIAIDPSGNAWIGNNAIFLPNPNNPYSVFELTNGGSPLSGTNGYTGGGLNSPRGIAIDGTGNAWIANSVGNSISKFSSFGLPLTGTSGFTGGALNFPINIAIDSLGNVWAANAGGNANADDKAVTKLSNSGSILSGTTGFTDGGQGDPFGIAIDSLGDAWVTYPAPGRTFGRIVKFSNSGTVLSGSTGYSGNGLGDSLTIAIDGSGNAWTANYYDNSVIELSNSGAVLSGTNGYNSGDLYLPYTLAVDGSGNVWVMNGSSITELIGIATPVVTPLSVGVKNNMLGTRP